MMIPILDPIAGGSSSESSETDELVLVELWISFVSLLRSHLGALQTTGKLGQATFVERSLYEIDVVDISRTLHISLQVGSGDGEWSLKRMGEMIGAGSWILHTDATASIDDSSVQDMEFAVESFTEKLWARSLPPTSAVNAGESLV